MMRSIFNLFSLILMNNIGSVGALGGTETPPPGDGESPPSDAITPDDGGGPSPEKALYGEIKVSWPEGIDDGLKSEASLKSFVDGDGNINYANLAKSFVHTKKQMGMDKAVLPHENSSDDEINDFWSKLGFQPDKELYSLKEVPETKLEESFMKSFKDFAHDNKMPVGTADKLAEFLNGQIIEGEKEAEESQTVSITEGVDQVKQEYGQAYDQKINLAKRVIQDVISDPEISKVFDDPMIGSNPAVIRAMIKVGEKMFSEDSFRGNTTTDLFSPAEADEKINQIMGDKSHAYHKPTHPSHGDAVKKMMKLFEMKN